jgi:Zn-dependent protease
VARSMVDELEEPRRRGGVLGGSAWRVGRVAGIDIGIDQSWFLIYFLISISLSAQLASALPEASPLARWGAALATSALAFTSIVLHELGHSLVAQSLGVRVRSITLFLFGGVAQLESEPRKPSHEVAIALAGPAVSVALGLGFGALARVATEATLAREAITWLGRMNLALGLFNLAPGFPLDGGRVLRGVVWAVTRDFARATRVAATAGSLLAGMMMLAGVLVVVAGRDLVGGLWLVFLGWFLLAASRAPGSAVELERVLGKVRIAGLLEPVEHAAVSGRESVADVLASHVLGRGVRTLYAVDGAGKLLGVASLRELAAVPPEARAATSVADVMVPAERAHAVSVSDSALDGLRRLAEARVNQLPALDGGRLVGVLTREHLLVLLEAELRMRKAAGAGRREAA